MSDHQSSIFGVGHVQHSLKLTAAPPPPRALTEKYRPRSLADVVGQGSAVYRLMSFVETPYPTAFLFHGDTGTGKTSAALALAADLAVNPDWALYRISSGTMDADAVESVLKNLRYTAPGGGWKVVIADEADLASPKAKQLWLSVMEELPARSVIVFTTNHVEKFEQRFKDRCEVIAFESNADLLMQDAQTLAVKVWTGEGYPGKPLNVATMPNIVEKGAISFRRVVQALQSAPNARPTLTSTSPSTQRQNPSPVATGASRATTKKPMTPEVAAMWRNAGLKAAATRKANLARKVVANV